jgi:hypothetical protein
MNSPTTPEQDRLDALIHEAAHLALWLAGHLRDMLAPLPGKVLEAPFLRHVLRHYLMPAEAALRRAVHLIASDMDPLPVRARPFKPLPRAIAPLWPKKRETARPPAFRLTEPQSRPQTDYIPVNQRPRIRLLTPGAPSPPPRTQPARRPPASYESRLRRRFAALEAALANPVREATRLLRLRARQTEPKPLLSFAKIPGYRAKPINDVARAALDRVNAALLNLHLNTS